MEILAKAGKPLNRSQIAELMDGDSIGKKEKITKIVRRLLKKNDIKCMEVDRYEAAKLLNKPVHRRQRFYYYSEEY